MEEHLQNTTEKIRKPYLKPKLERVHLVAEEAVLSGCKNLNQFGPTIIGCVTVSNCSLLAS